MNDINHVAIHEAGHAVIGRVLGLSCGGASIVENETEGEAGYAIGGCPEATLAMWEARYMTLFKVSQLPIRCRSSVDRRSAYRGTIMLRMAGAEAEIEILGECEGGDGNDRYLIEMMANAGDAQFSFELWQRYEPRMRRQVRRLIRKHRNAIERVAAALLVHRTLSGEEIDALV